MNPNTNTLNRLRYGLYAPLYDLVGRHLNRGRARSIALLNLQPGERVLIVGAGTGLDLPLLPADLAITAVDLSSPMLRQAEARAETLKLDVKCEVMDAHALDLPDASFDAVLLHLILAVVPDPYAAIREAARVLKPGGRAGIFDKFVPSGTTPSLPRRIAGALTNVLFSDINRQLEPLLDEANLDVTHDEPSIGRGLFKVVIARKPESE